MPLTRREMFCAGAIAGSALVTAGTSEAQTEQQDEFTELIGLELRVVRPGEAFTEDYRDDRLTVFVDDADEILDARIM